MRPGSLVASAGFIILLASTWSPLLRPLHLFSWNVYDLNKPYGVVLLLVAAVGVISSLLNQINVARYTAITAMCLVILIYLAAVLKVHTTFSFIPFKSVSAYLAGQVKFKWGWLLMFSGALLAFAGIFSIKKQFIRG